MTDSLYIHIPFCESKCSYCDFYSGSFSLYTKERYIDSLIKEIEKWGRLNTCPIDTVYFGGGTPSLLTDLQLERIITAIRENFEVIRSAEITCEVNPGDRHGFLDAAVKNGVNRISVGIQSSSDNELKILGRRHSCKDAVNTVEYAKKCGIDNISGDLMIGLPNSSIKTLDKSIKDILSLDLKHISAYILKIESGTPFYKNQIVLPDDDEVAEQYLYMCNAFRKAGYQHYEISNFALDGYESRHNNKYWLSKEYIGIGAAAHSFFGGKRFYYPRDIKAFTENPKIIDDGIGGDAEEFIMLALRLSRGLVFSEYESRFGPLPEGIIKKAKLFKELCIVDDSSVRLTDRGMLLSNSIITEVLK